MRTHAHGLPRLSQPEQLQRRLDRYLIPAGGLHASVTYRVHVAGGADSVRDTAGNALAADFTWSFTTGGVSACTGPNPIVCENQLLGSLPSDWDISGAGDDSIQGFSTDISVNVGGTIRFKVARRRPRSASTCTGWASTAGVARV